tara:strand:- start:2044 stop:3132 length:1089 start_codon:yes stop_codon:yes gene_type:complete
MKNINELTPAYAIHPGEMLLDEIEAREMSQTELGQLIGYKKSQLNEVIKGKRGINAKLAILLEAILEIPADFWLNAQKEYELNLAMIEAKPQVSIIEKWKSLSTHVDMKYLKQQNFLCGEPEKDIETVYDILGLGSTDNTKAEEPALAEHYRLSGKLTHDQVSLNTWTAVSKFQANHTKVEAFDKSLEDDLIFNLKTLLQENKDLIRKIKELLSAYGIKFIIQEKANKVPVDGMAFWSDDNPAIVMTMRHKRINNFAFTLFHELGHVFKHLQPDSKKEFVDLERKSGEESNKIEHEANVYAKNQLVEPKPWTHFMERTFKFNSEAFKLLAHEQGIHPAIVSGLYQFETGDFRKPRGIDFKIY